MSMTTKQAILDSISRHQWADVTSVAVNQLLGGIADMTRMKQARKQAAALLIEMAEAGLIEQHGSWGSASRPEQGGPSFHLPTTTGA